MANLVEANNIAGLVVYGQQQVDYTVEGTAGCDFGYAVARAALLRAVATESALSALSGVVRLRETVSDRTEYTRRAEKLRASLALARSQAEAMLAGVNWAEYGEILYIGKSIGTVVAGQYTWEKGLTVRSVLLTPLAETFPFVRGRAIAFHGTADPWAETGAITEACRARGIPLFLTEGANHSLETGDALRDVRTLAETMERIDAFLKEACKS